MLYRHKAEPLEMDMRQRRKIQPHKVRRGYSVLVRLLKQAGNFCGKYPYRQIRAVGADVRHFTGRIFVGSKCFPVRDFAFS